MSDLYDDNRPEQEPEKTDSASAADKTTENREEKTEPVTYSWVSPKLRQQSDEQETADPWGGSPKSIPDDSVGKTDRKAERRRRKSSGRTGGAGKRWTATVAAAVVFGLVAGLVFSGVTAAGKHLTAESEEKKVEIASTVSSTADDSSENKSEGTATSGGTVADVAAQCMPSLVTISTISVEQMQSFFGQTQSYEVGGAGTGVIVGQNDTELLIATNNHVVSGATSLSVGFIDETAVSGAVKGSDEDTDLAVVAVKLEDISSETMNQIKICEMGNSDELVLGEQVVAIGNALGYGQSVTSGYVSAFNRELNLSDGTTTFTSTGLIQTDASINSGNSGGALLNMRGQLIGINEAKSSGSSTSASVDNIGFAIPIAKAEPILENLMTLKTRAQVDSENASYIGITCADVNKETADMYNLPTGVCITSIMEGSPAESAGLKKGDIITSFDGRSVGDYSELTNILKYYAAGETVEIVVERSDEGEYTERTFTVTLGAASEMQEKYQSGNSSQESQNEEQQRSQGRGQLQP